MPFRAQDRDPIRVLLGPMPALLCDMIENLLASEADILLLGRSEEAEPALASACSRHADLLIVQSAEHEANGLLDAIVEAPPFSIFALSTSGKDATAVKFVHEDIVFDPSSRTAFAAAIRRVARTPLSSPAGGEKRWRG